MTLAYSQYGDGPSLVLLHAFPLSRDLWRDVAPILANEGWRVITPDLPGFGASTGAADGMEGMAVEVAALLDALGVHSAVIGGCSMGGYVALEFARQFPSRVAGLLLVDTKAGADDDDARANRERIASHVESAGSTAGLAATMPDSLLGATTRATRPDLIEWTKTQINANAAQGVADAQRAMAMRRAQFDTLASLRVPVMCIRGSEDTVSNAADHAAMAAAARDAVDIAVPAAGHLLPIEQPGAFADHVSEFLQQVRGPHC